MPLGPNAIRQLTKLVTGIPKVLKNIPTIAKDPIAMFGTLAAHKEITEMKMKVQAGRKAAEDAAPSEADIDSDNSLSPQRKQDMKDRIAAAAEERGGPLLSDSDEGAIIAAKIEQLKPTLLPALAPISTLFGFPVPLQQLIDFLKDSSVSITDTKGGGGSKGGGGGGGGNGENGKNEGNGIL